MARKPLRPCSRCRIELTRERFCSKCKAKGGGWGPKKKGAYDARWRKLRAVALERDMYLCVPCKKEGRMTRATEVDHVIPRSLGGADEMENLQSICRDCHKKKTASEGQLANRINHAGVIG